jgi:hypothetical protein
LVKVSEKLPPPEVIMPESHMKLSPLSLVLVCGALVPFIQTTVAPTGMVTLAGAKLKLPDAPVMLIVVAFAGVPGVAVLAGAVVLVGAGGGGVDVAVLVAPLVEPQPASATSAPSETTNAPRLNMPRSHVPCVLMSRSLSAPLVRRCLIGKSAMIRYAQRLHGTLSGMATPMKGKRSYDE